MAVTAVPEQSGNQLGQSMERDPRWLLVQRIVATAGFARSPRLVAFLLFVAGRSLAGEANEINEQSIGVRVFGRTSGYDSNDDNIVRSHATRLRQKLEAYFQAEGAQEPLRVSIPKGSYVPIFESQPVAAPLELRPRPIPPRATVSAVLPKIPPRHWLFLIAACIVSSAATCFVTAVSLRKPTAGAPEANRALWQELLAGPRKTLVVDGDSSLVLYENATGRTLPLAEYLSGNYRDQVAPQTQADPHMLRTIARRRLTSIVDLEIANRIATRSELAPDRVAFRYARDLRVDDLKGANIVLIGSQEANPWVQLYADSLNFTLVPDQQTKTFTVYNRKPKTGEAPEYRSIAGDPERRAYAAVAFVQNLDGTGHALLVQGTGMAGTEAAADYVLGQTELTSLLRAYSPLPNFEALLETSNLNGNAPRSKLVALRINGR